MKLAKEILEALKKQDLDAVREEVTSSFTKDEMGDFGDFEEFFSDVEVQNGYEEEWNSKKWLPFYKAIWDEFKSGKLKF